MHLIRPHKQEKMIDISWKPAQRENNAYNNQQSHDLAPGLHVARNFATNQCTAYQSVYNDGYEEWEGVHYDEKRYVKDFEYAISFIEIFTKDTKVAVVTIRDRIKCHIRKKHVREH